MNLYIVKYCANEHNDYQYSSPYPIYYLLNRDDALGHFKEFVNIDKKNLTEYIYKHPELKNNEKYSIETDNDFVFEYTFGKWYYKYIFVEEELEKDLRY